MKKFSQNDLSVLIRHKEYPSISIYFPTHVKGLDVQQDPIKLRNLLNKCQTMLEEKWAREKVLEFLKPGFDLQSDNLFWKRQREGFALFISSNFSQYFSLSVAPLEKSCIGNYFFILPLLNVLQKNKTYYILVLRQKGIMLFEANFSNIRQIELHNVPQNIEEILKYDVTEEHLQVHSVPSGRIAGSDALFHGQGNIADDTRRKKNIERYFKEVAKGLDKKLHGRNIPMVLAGVEYDRAVYRQNSSYRHIVDEGFSNNFGKFDILEIHQLAQKIVQPYFEREIEDSLTVYQNLINTQKTSTDIREILPAAYSGRVNTLLVDISKTISGTVDRDFKKVEIGENARDRAEDLLNLAAICTLQSDAKVCPISSEEIGGPVAALYRY